jgi:hypothetical protein
MSNKSAVPRVHGWPGKCLFGSILFYPAHIPPRPSWLRLLVTNIALGSITPKLTYILVVQGPEPQMGIKPGTALLRDAVEWRSYGQRNPLFEFKEEAYNLFQN